MKLIHDKREAVWLALLFFLAAGLRIAYTCFLQKHYFFYDHPSADVTYYQDWAYEIASGNWIGDQTFFGLPLYPYFLAVIDRLTLGHPALIQMVHLLLGSFNCLLVYFVAKKLFSPKVAGLAGVLMAANFVMIHFDWLMTPVTLIITLSLIVVLAFLNIDTIIAPREWFIVGILAGLGTLADGKLLLFFAMAWIYTAVGWPRPWNYKMSTRLLPLALGVVLVISVITVRNKIVGGDWVFISAQSGLSFYVGNNPDAIGTFENPDFIRPTHAGQDADIKIVAQSLARKEMTPGEVSQFWKEKAMTFIAQNPDTYGRLLVKKFLLFFTDTERAHDLDLIFQRHWRKHLDVNPYLLICPLALMGMFITARRKIQGCAYLNFMIASQLLFTLIFFLTTRHRASILPFLLIYESFFLWWVVEKIKVRQFRPVIPAAAFFALYIVLFPPESLDLLSLEFVRHAKAGPVYEKKGNLEQAKLEYYAALQLRAADTNTLYNLGNVYFQEGNIAKAQELYQTVITFCHFHVDALYNLATTYEATGEKEKAISTYEKVLEFEPDTLDAHLRLALLYQEVDECSQADHHFNWISQKFPHLTEKVGQMRGTCPAVPPDASPSS